MESLMLAGWRLSIVATLHGCRFMEDGNYMEQIPFGKADSSSAIQIPRILWNPKVYYRIHKRPPLLPNPSQINPIHILQTDFLKIHLSICLPSCLCRFPNQNPICKSPVPP